MKQRSLLDHVLDAPVTVLYGRSGLGKTSLLRAGLFPLLRERELSAGPLFACELSRVRRH